MCNVTVLDVGLLVKCYNDGVGQFFLVRTQGADEITKAFRQHRNSAVNKIDTRGSFYGLLIYNRALLDVVTDIGNMDAYFPQALTCCTQRQGIVEVFGILGVDGAGEHVTEVFTTGNFIGSDTRFYLLGSILYSLRIFIRQSVLCQDSVHLHVIITFLTQHVNHFTHNILRFLRRPLGDFHDSLVTCLTAFQFLLGNQDVLGKDSTLGNEEGKIALHFQLTHCLIHLMRQHLDHHSLLDMILTASHHRHTDTVAIQSKHRVALGDKDGFSAIVGLERIFSISLTDERSLLYLCLQIEAIRVVTGLGEIVVPCHFVHRFDGEHLGRMRIKFQRTEYLFKRKYLIRMFLEESLQHFYQLLLIHSFSTFLFTHSSNVLSYFSAKIQNIFNYDSYFPFFLYLCIAS